LGDPSHASEDPIVLVVEFLGVSLAQEALQGRVEVQFLKLEMRPDKALRRTENGTDATNVPMSNGLA
jgi:hypothetical protein